MIQEGYILAIGLFIIGGITTYISIKKNEKNQKSKIDYQVNKTKGYDYNNPKRFFAEPLMRYILIPLALSFTIILPFAIIAGIMNDGGKFLLENYPFVEYILYGWLLSAIPLLIAYTVLYYVRGWSNNEKWKMEYT